MLTTSTAHEGLCEARGHRYDVLTDTTTSRCHLAGCGRVFVTAEAPDTYTGPVYLDLTD